MSLTKAEQASITKYDLLFESRLSKVETMQDAILKTLERIDTHLPKIENRIDSNFKWILGLLVFPFYSSVITFVAGKIFHWF